MRSQLKTTCRSSSGLKRSKGLGALYTKEEDVLSYALFRRR